MNPGAFYRRTQDVKSNKCQSSNSLAETKNFQNRSDGQLTANVDWKVQHKTV